ncbi:MAG TPA: hypothetical protein RMH99_27175 [Sandaracinaceae bacterium LLY-WYZ-13_1]|nr:hypothetical protein [Sandaracinaceae bacterium LLY-WYZ-13_1]
MTILQLVGPFLLVQAMLFTGLLRGAILRPPPSDEDRFALGLAATGALAALGVAGLLLAFGGPPWRVGAQLGCAALAVAWIARRRRAPTHLDDLQRVPHEVVERIDGAVRRVRLRDAGDVAGVRWPADTVLALERGVLRSATPPEPMWLGRWPAAAGEPMTFGVDGALSSLTLAEPAFVGRLPRGPGDLRGARILAAAGSRVTPGVPRGTLAEAHEVRGVRLGAGSVVRADSLGGTVDVELAAPAEVHGHEVPEGSRLRFRAPDQRGAPDVTVELGREAREGYRDDAGPERLAIWRDGRLERR